MRKVLGVFVALAIFLFFPKLSLATSEFSSAYDVHYDIDESGQTQVTEKITLKNQTDTYYASSFSLTIGATQVSEVEATDSDGTLEATVTQVEPSKEKITVKFPQQFAGKGKEYTWTLRFKSGDFTQKQGKIWQVSVPKIVSSPDLTDYTLILSVPVSFSDPSRILPEPKAQSETGGMLHLLFDKNQLLKSGILATFGAEQHFSAHLTYHIENSNVLPRVVQIALPMDTNYQSVAISKIDPEPENVITDKDGNFLALFKLNKLEKKDIQVLANIKLLINPTPNPGLSLEDMAVLTSPSRYWDKDNPLIKVKLSEIFPNGPPQNNTDKAQAIFDYVVSQLSFDNNRLKAKNFERLGAVTILSNPDSALSADFVDLFVTLSRAAGVPAREIVGFAYTNNTVLRPSSLPDGLTAWAQYYDPKLGWVMVDPTWQNTTSGADYFAQFDLNHLSFNILGTTSIGAELPKKVEATIVDQQPSGMSDLYARMNIPDVIYGIVPTKAQVSVLNKGDAAYPSSSIRLSASLIKLVFGHFMTQASSVFATSLIPPHGHIDYNFELRVGSIFKTYHDRLLIQIGDRQFSKNITVRPFFSSQWFPYIVIGVVLLILAFYLLAVLTYLKDHRKYRSLSNKHHKNRAKPRAKK